jgi:hypothetical protein
VVIVASAGMISEKNMKEIEDAGLLFILGMHIPRDSARDRRMAAGASGRADPGRARVRSAAADGSTDKREDQMRYYQYKHDRARKTLKGIDEQVGKAEQAVAGRTAVKRNRFVKLANATKSVNRKLEAKARALAGIKGYVTNIADPTPEQVIGAYHQLFQTEKSFRMAKSDLAARPIFHRTRDSIEAHLTIVFAAMAVSRWIEDTTGWSVKKFKDCPPLPHHPHPGRRARDLRQPTRYRTASARSSKRSRPGQLHTNLAQLGSH